MTNLSNEVNHSFRLSKVIVKWNDLHALDLPPAKGLLAVDGFNQSGSEVFLSSIEVESSAERQALTSVLSGQTFAGSAKLTAFLRFVCEEHWQGRTEQINEALIARQVFGRPELFNAGDDSIVRSSARLLRQRLDRYYKEEGESDPIRIVLPRGSYVPIFAPRVSPTSDDLELLQASIDVPLKPSNLLPDLQAAPLRRRYWIAGGALAAVSAVGLAALLTPAKRPRAPIEKVWNLLLAGPRKMLIVPADSGLVMWQAEQKKQISLEDYMALARQAVPRHPDGPTSSASAGQNLAAPTPTRSLPRLKEQRYTGVVAVRLAVEIMRLAGPTSDTVGIRYARDLHINELKESNAVLVGAAHANPWAGLFASSCAYWIDWNADRGFSLVSRPQQADVRPLAQIPPLTPEVAFAHIALRRNLGGRGHVLLISGTGSQGTDGGIDFLFDVNGLARTLLTAQSHSTWDEFEVLVRCRIRDGQNAGYDVIDTRISRT